MKTIFNSQQAFFNTNNTKDIVFRKQQLKKLKSVLQSNTTLLDEAIYKDFKKASFENYLTEISLLIHEIDLAINNLSSWSKRKSVSTNFANFPAKSYIIPEPLGTVLVIGAWNYPIQLSIAPVIAAIAAGNTIMLKPSEIASHVSNVLAKLINDNFDANYFHVIEGGVPETTELLELKFDKIFFTGSTTVGKIVYQAAAKNLIPVTLELGGKSPTIIAKDANLKMAAKRIVWAKFLNSGQTCIAPDYILVDKVVEKSFLELLKIEIQKTDYSIENQNYVQIINDKNVQRLAKLIVSEKIYFGGNINEKERIIQPTIMHNCTFEDMVMQEEIFGPILPVIAFTNINDSIEQIKALPKPLSCYIFTESNTIKNRILKEVSFGGGAVNDAIMHISNSALPFGGVGHSGIGNYHSKFGFDAFSHYKSILDKPTWLEFNFKYAPYKNWKQKVIKFLIG
jgi:aldehyde dehydrogenase (NAD+)